VARVAVFVVVFVVAVFVVVYVVALQPVDAYVSPGSQKIGLVRVVIDHIEHLSGSTSVQQQSGLQCVAACCLTAAMEVLNEVLTLEKFPQLPAVAPKPADQLVGSCCSCCSTPMSKEGCYASLETIA
jgi:hypothetical protein